MCDLQNFIGLHNYMEKGDKPLLNCPFRVSLFWCSLKIIMLTHTLYTALPGHIAPRILMLHTKRKMNGLHHSPRETIPTYMQVFRLLHGVVEVCFSELSCWWLEFQQHRILIFKVWNIRQHMKITKWGHHTICKHWAPITQWRSTTTHKNRPLNCQYTLDRTLGRPHRRDKYLTPARNEILIPWSSSKQPSHCTNWGITALHDMPLDWNIQFKTSYLYPPLSDVHVTMHR